MCMNTEKVVRLILNARQAYRLRETNKFLELIEELSQELGKVSIVDFDALLHSFMEEE